MKCIVAFFAVVGLWVSIGLVFLGGYAIQNAQSRPCNTYNANQCRSQLSCAYTCMRSEEGTTFCGCTDQSNIVGGIGLLLCVIGATGLVFSVVAILALICWCRRRPRQDEYRPHMAAPIHLSTVSA